MGRKARLNKAKVERALRKYRGGVYLAASALEVSPRTIYNYLEKYPDLQELKDSFAELMVDKAEYNLHDAVESGDPWAVKYALATKGKSRGYTERQEISGPDGKNPHVTIEYVNDPFKTDEAP